MKTMKRDHPVSLKIVRCAVYTRKSTEEGLEQEFNSLDAQREAGEAYVRSQAGEGWTLVPDRYDDGGFTGGNTDRPALQRLLADIEAGRIDAVIVYKVDRLSRSLLDFAKMMATFEARNVSFASVTQQFNTATSMGRLVLNVLLSFAQFEREIIAERTRDKIAATRRKGKWAGGHPVLGYDLDPVTRRLVVNPPEANQVREIFATYLRTGSLLDTLREAEAKGIRTKPRITKSGKSRGGQPLSRAGLHHLLTNVLFVGKVRYRDEVHPGEHAPILDPVVWDQVQARLGRGGGGGGRSSDALLQGVLKCGPCGCAMTPTHSRKGAKEYRYYVCSAAQRKGRDTCSTKSVPAGPVEKVVIDQVRAIGRDPLLLDDVFAEVRIQAAERINAIECEVRSFELERTALNREIRSLSNRLRPGDTTGDLVAKLAECHERLAEVDRKLVAAKDRVRAARR